QGVYKVGGIGTVPAGRVACGSARPGSATSALTSVVRSLESFHDSRGSAAAGEWVGLAVKGVPAWRVRRGDVVSDAGDQPARFAVRFTARIRSRPGCLRPGYVALVHVHTAHAPCRLVSSRRCDTKGTGEMLGERLDEQVGLQAGDVAEAVFEPLHPRLVVEPFREYPVLGRFVV
ncbi:hypothetical protein VOLCADRAFT_34197, partial [Volvox carteri f. nagariensis]